MPGIGRFPTFCRRFFRRARKLIGASHFAHFWRIVVALAGVHGRRSLVRIRRLCKNRRNRQAIPHFPTQARRAAGFRYVGVAKKIKELFQL